MKENEQQADSEELIKRITDLVNYYIDNEEEYSDDAQLAINPSDLSLEIADPDDNLPELDYYPVMDLVRGSASNPGHWEADPDAITEMAADYIFTK